MQNFQDAGDWVALSLVRTRAHHQGEYASGPIGTAPNAGSCKGSGRIAAVSSVDCQLGSQAFQHGGLFVVIHLNRCFIDSKRPTNVVSNVKNKAFGAQFLHG